MVIGVAKLKLMAPWVHSLKEKRMVVKSIVAKASNKFNISIAEVEELDVHQTIVIGFSLISNNTKSTNEMVDKIINYIEDNTEATLLDIEIEIINF